MLGQGKGEPDGERFDGGKASPVNITAQNVASKTKKAMLSCLLAGSSSTVLIRTPARSMKWMPDKFSERNRADCKRATMAAVLDLATLWLTSK